MTMDSKDSLEDKLTLLIVDEHPIFRDGVSELRHIQNNLSSRQHEVLALLSNGLSNIEISQSLAISQSTVKSHVSQLMTTLKADSRTHCVAEARRLGIIS